MVRVKALGRAAGRVAALLFAAVLVLSVAAYPAVSSPLTGAAVSARALISLAERTRAVAVNASAAVEALVAADNTTLSINVTVTWKGSKLTVTVGEALDLIKGAIAEGDLHLNASKSAYAAGDYLTAKVEARVALNYYGKALALALAVLRALRGMPSLPVGFVYMVNGSHMFRRMFNFSPVYNYTYNYTYAYNFSFLHNYTHVHNFTRMWNGTRVNGTCPPAWGIEVAVASVLRMAERLSSTLLSSRRVNYSAVAGEYAELLAKLKALANETIELLRECNVSAAAHLLGEMHRLVAAFIKEVNTELAVRHFEKKLGRFLNFTLPRNESKHLLELINSTVKAGIGHGKWHNKTKIFDVIPSINQTLWKYKHHGHHSGLGNWTTPGPGPGNWTQPPGNWTPPGQGKGKGKHHGGH